MIHCEECVNQGAVRGDICSCECHPHVELALITRRRIPLHLWKRYVHENRIRGLNPALLPALDGGERTLQSWELYGIVETTLKVRMPREYES